MLRMPYDVFQPTSCVMLCEPFLMDGMLGSGTGSISRDVEFDRDAGVYAETDRVCLTLCLLI